MTTFFFCSPATSNQPPVLCTCKPTSETYSLGHLGHKVSIVPIRISTDLLLAQSGELVGLFVFARELVAKEPVDGDGADDGEQDDVGDGELDRHLDCWRCVEE